MPGTPEGTQKAIATAVSLKSCEVTRRKQLGREEVLGGVRVGSTEL